MRPGAFPLCMMRGDPLGVFGPMTAKGVTMKPRVVLALLLMLWLLPPRAAAAPLTIIADPSDAETFGAGGVGDDALGDMGVGDTGGGSPDLGRRAVVRFDVRGLSAATVTSATLRLTILESRRDQFPAPGVIDSVPPFTNPGLGDTQVIHIADDGAVNAADYGSPSVGNDPGVLIPAAVNPGDSVTVEATKAVQQALAAGRSFVVFRIQTSVETDGDGLNDLWFLASANNLVSARRPSLDIETSDAPLLPRVTLDLNASSFSPGDTLVATFRLAPGSVGLPVDAYVVIEVPGRSFVSILLGGVLAPGIVPIATGFIPVALSGELVRYVITGDEPPGVYRFLAGLAEPGTLTPIGAVEGVLFIP
jgi:hypothetical protein